MYMFLHRLSDDNHRLLSLSDCFFKRRICKIEVFINFIIFSFFDEIQKKKHLIDCIILITFKNERDFHFFLLELNEQTNLEGKGREGPFNAR